MITTADSIQTIEIALTQASSGHPKESRRFTLDGSAELEKHLERTCQQVLAGVRRLIPGRRLRGALVAVWNTIRSRRPSLQRSGVLRFFARKQFPQ